MMLLLPPVCAIINAMITDDENFMENGKYDWIFFVVFYR